MDSKIKKITLENTKEILKKLDIKAKVAVEKVDENTLKVSIDGEDLGQLIGYHGKTLESLQLVLTLMANAKAEGETWARVLVDAGGWRASRETSLKEMAEREAEKVRNFKEEVALPPMGPADRRFIHLVLQDYEDLTSESEGEGEERRVVIKLKK